MSEEYPRLIHISSAENYKPGDMPPSTDSYIAWHDWAAVQHKAGLKQSRCPECNLWRYPQEMATTCCKNCNKSKAVSDGY